MLAGVEGIVIKAAAMLPRGGVFIEQPVYQFVAGQFSPVVRQEIYGTLGKQLAVLSLEGVGKFGLRLSCSKLEKEGDLTIGLVNLDTGKELFRLAFSIT